MVGSLPALKVGVKLGNGHFGEVFLGQDRVHGEVAVKVLSRKPDHDDSQWEAHKQSFLGEAQKLSKARHRNVVQVYHIEELPDGNSVRLCMAYCPGGSLQSAFEAGPLSLAAVRKIATEILLGLGALHARQMLHRDLKPGNVLLDAQNVAQIADFGLVTDDLLLGYGSAAGYSDHIAHEVWQGQGTSTKSDIWALGMTIYRLLHGKTWYEEAPDPRQIVPHGGFADTLKWLPHIPKSWRSVIRKMLSDAPTTRYQTAEQALNALSRLEVVPDWATTVSATLIRWESSSKTRKQVVEWKRHSQRRHEWSAHSEPVGVGRRKALGGSGGIVGSREALAGLTRFF